MLNSQSEYFSIHLSVIDFNFKLQFHLLLHLFVFHPSIPFFLVPFSGLSLFLHLFLSLLLSHTLSLSAVQGSRRLVPKGEMLHCIMKHKCTHVWTCTRVHTQWRLCDGKRDVDRFEKRIRSELNLMCFCREEWTFTHWCRERERQWVCVYIYVCVMAPYFRRLDFSHGSEETDTLFTLIPFHLTHTHTGINWKGWRLRVRAVTRSWIMLHLYV